MTADETVNEIMNTDQGPGTGLPIRHNLGLIYALSALIAIMMAAAAVMGLLYRADLYPTDDLQQSLVPTDVANLPGGLPFSLSHNFHLGIHPRTQVEVGRLQLDQDCIGCISLLHHSDG